MSNKNFNRKARAGVASFAMGAMALTGVAGAAMAAPGPDGIDPNNPVSLTITKYAGTPIDEDETLNDRDPLAGVEFTICKVQELDVSKPADWSKIEALNTTVKTTGDLGTDYTCGTDSNKTTGDTGVVTWGSTEVSQGVYFVKETKAPANVTERTAPFIVTLPLADNSNNSWIYDVNVYPKNAVIPDGGFEKEATGLSENQGPGLGATVGWSITNTIPTIQNDFTDYRLRDALDSRLEYVDGSSKITVGTTDLETPADYTITYDKNTDNAVYITLTEDGLKVLDTNQGETLTWTFDTKVISVGNGAIENTGELLVNNPGGDWDEAAKTPGGECEDDEEDCPAPSSTNWGDVKILKHGYSGETATLQGAVFQVFETEDAATACVNAVKVADGALATGCTGAVSVTTDETTTDKFTSGTNGIATIAGLYVGEDTTVAKDYYLVEIVPPTGFINANQVITVNVKAGTTDVATPDASVSNAQIDTNGMLPATGGAGTLALIISAIVLGGGFVGYTAYSKKKKVATISE